MRSDDGRAQSMMRTSAGAIGAVCVGLAVGLSACHSPATPTQPQPTGPLIMQGTVTTYSTGQPVAFAPVTYESIDGASESSTATEGVGHYALQLRTAGSYVVRVDGVLAGSVFVSERPARGDLLIDDAGCRSRYGLVSDARTLRPVSSAAVSLPGGVTTTDSGGWYRIDLGCEPLFNSSTSFLAVRHPSYQDFEQVVGRGVSGVLRLDAVMSLR